MNVYYLGPVGTFTYQAARQHFDLLSSADGRSITYIPVTELSDLPSHLTSDGDVAVIPFENSTNGHVVPTLNVLRTLDAPCRVTAEIYLTVHQCLLGHESLLREPSPPTSNTIDDPDNTTSLQRRLAGVKRIYSHLQAFGQCESFLSAHNLDKLEHVNVDSTGRAAALCSQDLESVAIASAVSARPVTEAVVLAKDIEDNHDNTTRFLVLSNTTTSALADTASSYSTNGADLPTTTAATNGSGSGRDSARHETNAGQRMASKSLLRITVAHETPGALATILSEFAKHDINLTSIASRPLPPPTSPSSSSSFISTAGTGDTATRSGGRNNGGGGGKWRYVFFIEFEGGAGEPQVDAALRKIEGLAQTMRLLGTFTDLRRTA